MIKKALLGVALSVALVAGAAIPASAATQTQATIDQSVATQAQLQQIVTDAVSATFNGIESTITSTVSSYAKSTFGNPDAIKSLAKQYVVSSVTNELAKYGISDQRVSDVVQQAVSTIVDNAIVNFLLTNDFSQAVINRTIDYATADAVSQLGISADRDSVVANVVSSVWNAQPQQVGSAATKVKAPTGIAYLWGVTVSPSYYNYTVNSWNTGCLLSLFGKCLTSGNTDPKDITVTGWNSTVISTYAGASAAGSGASALANVQSKLSTINFPQLILNNAGRAVVDEINARVQTLVTNIKTQIVTALQTRLNQLGVAVTLNPADSYQQIFTQVASAIKAAGLSKIPAL